MKQLILVLALAGLSFSNAQTSSSVNINQTLDAKRQMQATSLVKNVAFDNIGPTVMSGRVVDLAVNPKNPTEFYVGYASGGLWHTKNNGTSFTPILDSSDTQNVGDIAVDWNTGTIWVGTGENNSSRSSYAGIGILKSTDNGKTWENMGLTDSHHIGRIIIHKNNPDQLVVGVTGHLYTPNKERGIYKTTDGGKTWKQTLYVDDMSGIIDVSVSPSNPDILFASSWTKDRKAWNFDGSGNNSGIYKSTDGGDSWTEVSLEGSGFPTGKGVGRIGLAAFNDNVIYAIHDNQFRREKKKQESKKRGLTKDDFKTMTVDAFLALEDKKLNGFLKQNNFQEKYRAQNVKQMVRSGNVKPIDLAKYLEDANSLLFDTPVIGTEVYKSTDGGKSWKKTHDDYLDGIYFSYGYYFGHIYVDPSDENGIYIYGVPILTSKDGGKTFKSIGKENVHADHHALWINPNMPGHLINGNDGGVNITYDDGETWIKNNSPSVGQFYAINVDNEEPYNVYGGLQDNGVWMGSHTASENRSWHQSGQYPWKSIMGGDGMQVQVDSRNSNTVYTGFQFGNYFRVDVEKSKRTYIQPKHTLGENPYRFNWQTPILLSPHNQDILYLGGNKLMRSMNQGDEWEAISDDLTGGGKKGNVAYGTLTTISESSFTFGLIYTGSDDGHIHITKNAGGSWENISNTLPKDLWVSRVEASNHKKERVYASLNGYRNDDFTTYIYKSDDHGKSWKNISSNIPHSPVNVIKEDPENENILYVGTDNGLYVSFDMGTRWEAFSEGLPNVAFHDLVIQKQAKHLVAGTHGRSIYKTDIAPLQKMSSSIMNSAITIFDLADVKHSFRWGGSWSKWLDPFVPEMNFSFYTNAAKDVTVKVLSEKGIIINEIPFKADKGFNYGSYDLSFSEKGRKTYSKKNKDFELKEGTNGVYYLPKGKYAIEIDGKKKSFNVK